MEANAHRMTDALLPVINIPKDGRMLTFGAGSALVGLEAAAARPDVLVVVCDTTSGVTRDVSDRSLEEKLHNIVVGDTPAGPLVDRALVFESFADLTLMDLNTMRQAMLPGGYAIFAETAPGAAIVEKLKECGYQVADELPPIEGYNIVRAR